MEKIGETRVRYQQIFEQLDSNMKKTKIVCTLGVQSSEKEMLIKMIDSGMNIARLNMSDGDHKSHGETLESLQAALEERPERTCSVMLDTKGPEITLWYMRDNKPVELRAGQQLKVCTDMSIEGDTQKVACSYKQLPQSVRIGSQIYIGGFCCDVCENGDDFIVVNVKQDFVMEDKMLVTLPGAIVDLPILDDKDEDDIVEFGLKSGIDFISASFVRKASDVEYIRGLIGQKGANIRIISKIQTHEGLHNFDEILQESDGVMIMRNDLSMEIPPEKVFIAQKWMVEKANLASKPVMVCGQIFDTMCKNARPSRQEASDVSNAIMDGVDAVVLDDETAFGDYPINAVSMLGKCCIEAETTIDYRKCFNDLKLYSPAPYGTAESVACAAVNSVLDLKVDLIIILTDTGKLARLTAKYRPECAIVCCSSNLAVIQHMNAQRGVVAVRAKESMDHDQQVKFAIAEARKMKYVKSGNKVITIHGVNEDSPDESNVMKILNVE